MSQRFEKLKGLLRTLFQLDQPDLDFGLYRIMHAKSGEVTQFLERDLLPQVKAAFAQYQPADKAALEKELKEVRAGVEKAGMDPAASPKVRELEKRIKDDAVDLDALEAEVYDHLYSFFRRYYSDGDFLSQRVYKAGVYAIPYEGEEVKLHWANHDQYYIKTSEYLRDYAFRLRPESERAPMRVHFRLVDVAEGEHGNVKAAQGKERVFVLAPDDFIVEEDGELVIRFEYRPATIVDWPEEVREGKAKPPAQKDLTAIAERRVLGVAEAALVRWIADLAKPHVRSDGSAADSTRLRAHLDRYTKRNTFDYFIHKDLGGFLRRELDFYIKNEVMHLDDVESETVPRVEQYLSKIKVIRCVAHKLVAFLAQLENFQKKLWLKRKFVVETQWCVTVGCIPEAFYPEILANSAQREEWARLQVTIEVAAPGGDLFSTTTVSSPASLLRAHPTLMVDTRNFSPMFTSRLLEALGAVDEQTHGVLIKGENSQALSLIHVKYRGKVHCIYIDPPYNTGGDGFPYKDAYQHSSWLALLSGRIEQALDLLGADGVFACSLDDNETYRFGVMIEGVAPSLVRLGEFVWRTRNTDNRVFSRLSVDHEYIHVFAPKGGRVEGRVVDRSSFKNPDKDPRGPYTTDPLTGKANAKDRPNLHYSIVNPVTGDEYPPHPDFGWITDQAGFAALLRENRLHWPKSPKTGNPRKKRFLSETTERAPVSSLEIEIKQGEGNRDLADLFGEKLMNFPKPVSVMKTVVDVCAPSDAIVLDFFAGSGTSGDAVLRLNGEEQCARRFLLVESGDYFDTLLLPRIKKVSFSPNWRDGKPSRLATPEEAEHGPRIVKVIRLESYEDALNNLDLRRTDAEESLLDRPEAQGLDGLREQYLLRYMLDVETRGSQSLLNVAAFIDPTAYRLKVKRPGSDETREVNVDLLETFNWLIGLTVRHIAAPQTFTASFERDNEKRLRLRGRLREDPDGPWWFRSVTGTTPDGRKTLVIWRKRPGGETAEGIEQDNLALDAWFTKQGYSSKDSEFDLIYVNGDNNLENLKAPDDTWKVRLIEEDFHRLMFETEAT